MCLKRTFKNSMTVEADSNIFLTAFHSESHLPCQRWPGWALCFAACSSALLPPDLMDRLLHLLHRLSDGTGPGAASQAMRRTGSWLGRAEVKGAWESQSHKSAGLGRWKIH